MVSFYSNTLWLGLITFTVLGAIDIWQLFQHRDSAAARCAAETQAETQDLSTFFGISFTGTQTESCQKLADVSAIVVAVLFGVTVLVLMWLVGIVTKYKHQLQESEASRYGQNYAEVYAERRGEVYGNVGRSGKGKYAAAQTREMGEKEEEGKAGLLHTTTPPAGWKDVSYEQVDGASAGHHRQV